MGQFLNLVFAADGNACTDGFPDGIGAVHFGSGAEGDGGRISAAGLGGLGHPGADGGYIFGDGHIEYLGFFRVDVQISV